MRQMLAMRGFWSGVIFIVAGAAGLWIGRDYPRGTLSQMGPGYFPQTISTVLIGIGLLVGLQAARNGGAAENMGVWPWRALVLIPAGLTLFGVLVSTFGIIPAAAAVIILPGLATPDVRPLELTLFAAVLIVLSILVFVYGLGLNFRILPWE